MLLNLELFLHQVFDFIPKTILKKTSIFTCLNAVILIVLLCILKLELKFTFKSASTSIITISHRHII